MKHLIRLLVVAMLATASTVATADNLEAEGRTYKNIKVTLVEPDGVTISHSAGVCKIAFPDLPKEWQEKYGYDPGKAAAYQQEVREREQQRRDLLVARGRDQETMRVADRGRLSVDIEVVEVRSNGVVVTGAQDVVKMVTVEQTNAVMTMKGPSSFGGGGDGGGSVASPGAFKTKKRQEARRGHNTLERTFVVGLPESFVTGSRWSGVIYPTSRATPDGLPQYATTLQRVVVLQRAVVLPPAAPEVAKIHPFLRGLGDGLTWPVRAGGCSDLHFAPAEDREVRYWAGAIVGGSAYIFLLLPLLSRREKKR